ncbi:MAG: hypothetical protein ABS53_09535 [Hydrogenophaga sp. SCN 70-13]|uniref:DUF4148 domain-containing protein n=1 Tax=Hydrogenophaga TaxID=47420 RepID=UPI00086C8761|nr:MULTISPECIES: DUF4148 domain-containing protein [unclassified Hydrogenophaga]MBN9371937.1 DUF4148 domain-containing protein [Hydrogenophaga sp.]ODT31817.1 MAG: hypothetical protein ABS53_09535 [Hydrogenophaga sp. SCN 70-13]OJV63561.1 MAG: hypothetical protein BGO22_11400 [Hydrogenophaga sp. 70-12]
MKTAQNLALSIALALGAGAAFAEGPIEGNEVFNFQSTLSRAEVQAQAVQANRAGLVARGEIVPVQETVADSGLSRAQVRAETIEARRLGLIASGEILPVATPAQVEQIRTAGLRAVGGDKLVQSGQPAVTAH